MNNIEEKYKTPSRKMQKSALTMMVICFAMLYASISLVNHYCFRTYALDLGLYTNALYKYAHFMMADSTMIKENFESLLAGHFDLYLILFSPLIYIFGTWTLLVVQIIAILFGGIGVFNFMSLKYSDKRLLSLYAALYFYLFFGVFSALSFDYHSNVVAASAVPWFFYYFYKRKHLSATILLFFIIISQENVALWMIFILIGLMIECKKDKHSLAILLIYLVISLSYFIAVIEIIIPHFANNKPYSGFLYSVMGNSPLEALTNIITKPFTTFKLLFINHNHNNESDFIKAETHIFLLISGAYMLIKKPQYLLMLLPIYFQKLLHNNNSMWSVAGQYSIEFAPILAIGIFSVIAELKQEKIVKIFSYIILTSAAAIAIRSMDHTVYLTDKSRIRFYTFDHYKRSYDINKVHQTLEMLPKNAAISAQSQLIPHLALRNKIYQFPIINDADYIIFSPNEGNYPLTAKDFSLKIEDLINSGQWKISNTDKELTILKKIKLPSV